MLPKGLTITGVEPRKENRDRRNLRCAAVEP